MKDNTHNDTQVLDKELPGYENDKSAFTTKSMCISADSIERSHAPRVRRKSSVMMDYDDDVRVDIPNVGDETVR